MIVRVSDKHFTPSRGPLANHFTSICCPYTKPVRDSKPAGQNMGRTAELALAACSAALRDR